MLSNRCNPTSEALPYCDGRRQLLSLEVVSRLTLILEDTMRAYTIPQVEEFCRRWKIAKLATTPTKQEESDLGVFVRFEIDADWNLTDRLQMERELQQLAGRPVRLAQHPTQPRNSYSLSVIYNA
jgi:predicted nucleotidyltransferase